VQKNGACAWVLQVEAQGIARLCLKNVTDEVYAALTKAGYFYDPVEREVYLIARTSFHPQTDMQHSLIMSNHVEICSNKTLRNCSLIRFDMCA
jgi:hypothetical protein